MNAFHQIYKDKTVLVTGHSGFKGSWNEVVTHGKGNDSKQKPILCNNKLTWNYYRCEPCKLRDDFHHFLENYVVGGELTDGIALLPGEALFFKDEDILHGRTSFIGRRWLIKGGIYV